MKTFPIIYSNFIRRIFEIYIEYVYTKYKYLYDDLLILSIFLLLRNLSKNKIILAEITLLQSC